MGQLVLASRWLRLTKEGIAVVHHGASVHASGSSTCVATLRHLSAPHPVTVRLPGRARGRRRPRIDGGRATWALQRITFARAHLAEGARIKLARKVESRKLLSGRHVTCRCDPPLRKIGTKRAQKAALRAMCVGDVRARGSHLREGESGGD